MRFAKGARMRGILGATLAAILSPGVSTAEITSDSAEGISSGSITGISSGSVDGISSGSVDGISSGSVDGISSGSIDLLTGPVASINADNNTFVAMGQVVLASADMLARIEVGDLVTVSGTIAGQGTIFADSISVASEGYVAGASVVLVTGIPSLVDAGLGTATIGSLVVDYTPSLGGNGNPDIGIVITVEGIQPVDGGVMLSDSLADSSGLLQ
ncbi:MAG: hypothetical protein KJO31_08045 [Gammaproteobacteria bacterium]|nr:hypothetical protein [Gammaproteobacteria bacterium]